MADRLNSRDNADQLTNTRTRSHSRTGRPSSRHLHRIYSRGYLDDRSLYHHEAAAGASDEEPDGEPDDRELEGSDHSEQDAEKDGEIVPEFRDGIVDERDVEKKDEEREPPALTKAQSARSRKDPNLV